MRKTALLGLVITFLMGANVAFAQSATFWSYDDWDNEIQIPAECDGVFDDSRGGVFVPTPEEMAEQGELFLLNGDPIERSKAGFCLIAAALQGHVPSQYRVAQLYNKGMVLPQDDLSAYRWAFLASMNGHQDAGKLALLLERFLTTEEIELATQTIQEMLPTIESRNQQLLNEQQARVDAKKRELDMINLEIEQALGIQTQKPVVAKPAPQILSQPQASQVAPTGSIFSESDRL